MSEIKRWEPIPLRPELNTDEVRAQSIVYLLEDIVRDLEQMDNKYLLKHTNVIGCLGSRLAEVFIQLNGGMPKWLE
jgi:hypothetical protein